MSVSKGTRPIIFAAIWCFFTLPLLSQKTFKISEVGIPLMQVYSEEGHISYRTTYGIHQDHNGMLYFANSGGLIRFDGRIWDAYSSDSGSAATDVSSTDDGRLYGVTIGDIGYFLAYENGNPSYVSLNPRV